MLSRTEDSYKAKANSTRAKLTPEATTPTHPFYTPVIMNLETLIAYFRQTFSLQLRLIVNGTKSIVEDPMLYDDNGKILMKLLQTTQAALTEKIRPVLCVDDLSTIIDFLRTNQTKKMSDADSTHQMNDTITALQALIFNDIKKPAAKSGNHFNYQEIDYATAGVLLKELCDNDAKNLPSAEAIWQICLRIKDGAEFVKNNSALIERIRSLLSFYAYNIFESHSDLHEIVIDRPWILAFFSLAQLTDFFILCPAKVVATLKEAQDLRSSVSDFNPEEEGFDFSNSLFPVPQEKGGNIRFQMMSPEQKKKQVFVNFLVDPLVAIYSRRLLNDPALWQFILLIGFSSKFIPFLEPATLNYLSLEFDIHATKKCKDLLQSMGGEIDSTTIKRFSKDEGLLARVKTARSRGIVASVYLDQSRNMVCMIDADAIRGSTEQRWLLRRIESDLEHGIDPRFYFNHENQIPFLLYDLILRGRFMSLPLLRLLSIFNNINPAIILETLQVLDPMDTINCYIEICKTTSGDSSSDKYLVDKSNTVSFLRFSRLLLSDEFLSLRQAWIQYPALMVKYPFLFKSISAEVLHAFMSKLDQKTQETLLSNASVCIDSGINPYVICPLLLTYLSPENIITLFDQSIEVKRLFTGQGIPKEVLISFIRKNHFEILVKKLIYELPWLYDCLNPELFSSVNPELLDEQLLLAMLAREETKHALEQHPTIISSFNPTVLENCAKDSVFLRWIIRQFDLIELIKANFDHLIDNNVILLKEMIECLYLNPESLSLYTDLEARLQKKCDALPLEFNSTTEASVIKARKDQLKSGKMPYSTLIDFKEHPTVEHLYQRLANGNDDVDPIVFYIEHMIKAYPHWADRFVQSPGFYLVLKRHCSAVFRVTSENIGRSSDQYSALYQYATFFLKLGEYVEAAEYLMELITCMGINIPTEKSTVSPFQLLLTCADHLTQSKSLDACNVLKFYIFAAEALLNEEEIKTVGISDGITESFQALHDTRSRAAPSLGSELKIKQDSTKVNKSALQTARAMVAMTIELVKNCMAFIQEEKTAIEEAQLIDKCLYLMSLLHELLQKIPNKFYCSSELALEAIYYKNQLLQLGEFHFKWQPTALTTAKLDAADQFLNDLGILLRVMPKIVVNNQYIFPNAIQAMSNVDNVLTTDKAVLDKYRSIAKSVARSIVVQIDAYITHFNQSKTVLNRTRKSQLLDIIAVIQQRISLLSDVGTQDVFNAIKQRLVNTEAESNREKTSERVASNKETMMTTVGKRIKSAPSDRKTVRLELDRLERDLKLFNKPSLNRSGNKNTDLELKAATRKTSKRHITFSESSSPAPVLVKPVTQEIPIAIRDADTREMKGNEENQANEEKQEQLRLEQLSLEQLKQEKEKLQKDINAAIKLEADRNKKRAEEESKKRALALKQQENQKVREKECKKEDERKQKEAEEKRLIEEQALKNKRDEEARLKRMADEKMRVEIEAARLKKLQADKEEKRKLAEQAKARQELLEKNRLQQEADERRLKTERELKQRAGEAHQKQIADEKKRKEKEDHRFKEFQMAEEKRKGEQAKALQAAEEITRLQQEADARRKLAADEMRIKAEEQRIAREMQIKAEEQRIANEMRFQAEEQLIREEEQRRADEERKLVEELQKLSAELELQKNQAEEITNYKDTQSEKNQGKVAKPEDLKKKTSKMDVLGHTNSVPAHSSSEATTSKSSLEPRKNIVSVNSSNVPTAITAPSQQKLANNIKQFWKNAETPPSGQAKLKRSLSLGRIPVNSLNISGNMGSEAQNTPGSSTDKRSTTHKPMASSSMGPTSLFSSEHTDLNPPPRPSNDPLAREKSPAVTSTRQNRFFSREHSDLTPPPRPSNDSLAKEEKLALNAGNDPASVKSPLQQTKIDPVTRGKSPASAKLLSDRFGLFGGNIIDQLTPEENEAIEQQLELSKNAMRNKKGRSQSASRIPMKP